MAVAQMPTTFDKFLDEIVAKMTPEEILTFQLSEDEQDRIDDLLDRNNEGDLTAAEKGELQQIVELERIMSLLKAKAAYSLTQK
ncbi:MAG: hypothetical protein ABI690_24875 [Chloroflexota bacterium]